MTDPRHPLDRLAERGKPRGADEVLGAARAARTTSPARNPKVWAAAAAVAVVVAGALAMLRDDADTSRVRTVDDPVASTTAPTPATSSTTTPTSATSTPPPLARPPAKYFGFAVEAGIVAFVDHGDDVTVTEIGGVRGEEGETSLAVDSSGVVYHHRVFTGCRSDIVRTVPDGASAVLVENAVHPALAADGGRLAYASGSECTPDADLLSVRDLATGTTTTVAVGDPNDGLPWRITDVEWIGDRVAVLAHQYDGQEPGAQWVTLWALDAGTLRFDGQVSLGVGDPNTPGAVTGIEPAPADTGSVLLTRRAPDATATDVRRLALANGEETTLFTVDGEVGAFAAVRPDDIVYVAVQPKVDFVRGQIDTVRRRLGDDDVLLVEGINSVAVPGG